VGGASRLGDYFLYPPADGPLFNVSIDLKGRRARTQSVGDVLFNPPTPLLYKGGNQLRVG
jgi:hypothetical protein